MKTKLHQTYFLLALICTTLYAKCSKQMEYFGDWFFDQVLYQGKSGLVEFNCDADAADAVLRVRSFDATGRYAVEEIPFRIPNRWLLAGRRRPSGLMRMDINSQALLAGYRPINTQWLTATAKRITEPTFDLQAILNNKRVAKRTEQLARFHRLMMRWFPSASVNSYDPMDHSDMIIKRV